MLDKAYRRPIEIDPSDVVFDARPKTAQEAADELIRDIKEIPEAINALPEPYEPPPYDWGRQPIDRIDRIAELMRSLTYGEMTELATELWAVSNGGITEESLPQNLWDWAVKEN